MNTSTAALTVHVITPLSGQPWRVYLKTRLEELHPDADVCVGSGSLRDVMVWTKEMEMGTSPDLVSTVEADPGDEDLFDDEETFIDAVARAEDLAERVEDECDAIERAWKRSQRKVRAVGALAAAGTLVLGLFQ